MDQRQPASKSWPLMFAVVAVTIIVGVVLSRLSPTTIAGNAGLLEASQAPVPSDTRLVASASLQPRQSPGSTDTEEPTPDMEATQAFLATDTAWKQIVGVTAQYLVTTIGTAEPGPTGIVEGPDAGFSPLVYSIKNRWYGAVNGHTIAVFAGALADDRDQGMVYVIEWLDPRVEHRYLTPLRAGPVHIVAEQHLRLMLDSTGGTSFYFDVPGQRFVGSLTEVVPTVTPFQTSTPTPTSSVAQSQPVEPTCTPGPTATIVTAEPTCFDNGSEVRPIGPHRLA